MWDEISLKVIEKEKEGKRNIEEEERSENGLEIKE